MRAGSPAHPPSVAEASGGQAAAVPCQGTRPQCSAAALGHAAGASASGAEHPRPARGPLAVACAASLAGALPPAFPVPRGAVGDSTVAGRVRQGHAGCVDPPQISRARPSSISQAVNLHWPPSPRRSSVPGGRTGASWFGLRGLGGRRDQAHLGWRRRQEGRDQQERPQEAARGEHDTWGAGTSASPFQAQREGVAPPRKGPEPNLRVRACRLSTLPAKLSRAPRQPRYAYSRAYHAAKAQALREGVAAEEAALRAQMAGKAAAAAAEG